MKRRCAGPGRPGLTPLVPMLLIVSACSMEDLPTGAERPDPLPDFAANVAATELEQELRSFLEELNARLEDSGAPYRAPLITTIGPSPESGVTVLWRDTEKKLGIEFVAGDTRRFWSSDPDRITYAIDPVDGTTFNGVGPAVTSQEIRAAMNTWDQLGCSKIDLTEVPAGGDLGFAAGHGLPIADIQHAGWLDAEFIPPDAGSAIAATIPFVWIDGGGNATDIDNDGALDYAFAEIYYDAICQDCSPVTFWQWEVADGINQPGIDVDIQSIVLHEVGHALGQAHTGTGFFTPGNDPFLHLAPPAVMSASYVAPRTKLTGTDVSGHCSIWTQWPD